MSGNSDIHQDSPVLQILVTGLGTFRLRPYVPMLKLSGVLLALTLTCQSVLSMLSIGYELRRFECERKFLSSGILRCGRFRPRCSELAVCGLKSHIAVSSWQTPLPAADHGLDADKRPCKYENRQICLSLSKPTRLVCGVSVRLKCPAQDIITWPSCPKITQKFFLVGSRVGAFHSMKIFVNNSVFDLQV